ncbi:uncharacterized protein LOC118756514 [Rhagoletis pomonella]|uniref:uncharacterized protein LOC118756514 n=1 Tax=Rhagoletis pomonella TaxID=28610 RepID=UPI0017877ADB|nr:uncharacterized protein LOC118756514 [Rhagoletis pomonella]
MPELLCGTALHWYRNNNEHWSSWITFKRKFLRFFLPTRYLERLEDDIRQRSQHPREKYKEYVIAIQNLMRHAGYSSELRLERIFRNSHPDYLLYIRRRDFTTLSELLTLAEEYECIHEGHRRTTETSRREVARYVTGDNPVRTTTQPDESSYRTSLVRTTQHHPPVTPHRSATDTQRRDLSRNQSFDPNNVCRRCGQEGYYARRCRNAPKIFCWECGRANVRTIECCRRRQGNGGGAPPRTRRGEPTEPSAEIPITMRQDHGRLYALVHLGGELVEAVIDTGASKCFISTTLAEYMATVGSGERITVALEIHMADGTSSNTFEAMRIEVRLGQAMHHAVLYIMPGAIDDLILGLDTLGSMGAVVSCGGQQVVLTEPTTQPAPSATSQTTEDNTSLAVSNTIPPRTAKRNHRRKGRSRSEKVNRVDHDEPSGSVDKRTSAEMPHSNHTGEATRIRDFLAEELQKFETMSGVANVAEHRIIMTDDRPIKQRYFPRNPATQAIINAEIDELLSKGCIEPSCSPHSAPIVLARKKNGKWRLCVQLNARSVPDAYPLPRIQQILDKLRRAKYISSLDLKNGYWQISLEPNSRPYTAFTVPGRGLFQWRVMAFGLHSAPATFQRALDQVIGPEMEPHAFAYLDDIIVIGSTFEEHVQNLREVLSRLQRANLRINPEKCDFFKKELRYLGHVVSEKGIHTDPEKVAAIRELKPPSNVKEVRQYLGIASWYRRFVPDFATLSQPLTALLKKGKHWKWGVEQQEAFDTLKRKLTEAPVLACPDFKENSLYRRTLVTLAWERY